MSHWNVAYSMSEQLLQGHHGCRERPQKPHSRWHNPKPEGSAATLPPAHTSLPEGTPRNVDESRVCDARRPLPAAEFLSQGCFGWGSSSQWKLILADKRALAEIRVQKSFPLGSPSRHKHRITSADPPPPLNIWENCCLVCSLCFWKPVADVEEMDTLLKQLSRHLNICYAFLLFTNKTMTSRLPNSMTTPICLHKKVSLLSCSNHKTQKQLCITTVEEGRKEGGRKLWTYGIISWKVKIKKKE